MAKRTLAKDLEKYVIRLPDGMRARLQSAADDNGHSLNAEIVARIDAADDVRSVKADFELAKERISQLQNLAEDRRKMVAMMESALASAEAREKAMQSQIERLTTLLEKKLS
ncbi:MAG: Arc family DNA-binding protein [Rhizobiaceae bacterium]|nr:Arc family DNA-binding protein [Rhizobiaceae bacterium]